MSFNLVNWNSLEFTWCRGIILHPIINSLSYFQENQRNLQSSSARRLLIGWKWPAPRRRRRRRCPPRSRVWLFTLTGVRWPQPERGGEYGGFCSNITSSTESPSLPSVSSVSATSTSPPPPGSVLHSHWSSSNETRSFIELKYLHDVATPAILCYKEPLGLWMPELLLYDIRLLA